MAPLITLRGAAFGYGGRAVVRGVDLALEPGAFIGIVGPNGAGKTTLFRGILGLVPPLEGSVERGSTALGYVPQRENLDPVYPLSVEEVVHMGAYGRLRGWRALARDERTAASEALRRVGMFERARDAFTALSGGQRQRVLIARALLMRPQVLLLDEPTSGVDRAAQSLVIELLQRLAREEGLAVLLVSHQLQLVRRAVDEALWVADGRVVRGPATELLDAAALDRLYESGALPSAGGRA
ncbi:MAG: metal ABC transporter ATP-binding protein [Planctomycetota bacterium]|nr:MAG: metal ABC transporter ATP-binding protein [Planctomycetota bacterium]